MLSTIVYVSRSIKLMDSDELAEILNVARSFNSANDITGLLLYKDQSFIQVIEGDIKTLEALYARINDDDRHFRIRTLVKEPISERKFPDWSMGFQNINKIDINSLPGFSQFMSPEFSQDNLEMHANRVTELLYYFRARS
ncbi:BLUF domain-containing protein [Agarilytica rhodophyticola]|uniref:BLUF domain-containing protein n=1 Tax=Agarilytica rhodophyticola TaxID=1737490 RepID=UPI000B3430C5|nr:BLUF domain-containing protein [Agarilytica rhodophyticola]